MGRRTQNTCLRDKQSLAVDSRATLAQRLRAMRRTVSSILLTSFVLSPYGALAAGPITDSAAPTSQRPLVTTVGTVPVVNIVPPGSNGISHNKYERFDVPTQGAVLNNSQTSVTSTLAGAIAGNPNLTAGSARLILNEVTSNQPSSLLGQLEVAGPAARVVIANPNGITCDGCGFVNTPHVQIAAARPFFEGDTLRFELGAGRIDVGPLGLKTLATRLDFIAGQIATTGPMESLGAINMVAGGDASVGEDLSTRLTSSASSAGSAIAIDIGQSVAAGSIRLVLDSQARRTIRIRGAVRADEDVMVASRGEILIDAPISAGRDIGIANRDGMLEISNSLSPESPALDAGRSIQVLGFHGHARTTSLRAAQDIEIAMGQESVIGYSDYSSGEFPRVEVGNDLRLITGRGLVMPFWIERATVGRDLVAGPFGLKLLPGLQGTAGAAHYLPEVPDPYRQLAEADVGDVGGGFRGGIRNTGTIEVGRNAKLSYYSGPPLHLRNAELWAARGSDFSRIVADEDIVVKGLADSYADSPDPDPYAAAPGSVEAGRDIRFVSGFAPETLRFTRSLIFPLNGLAARDVIIDSPVGFASFGQVSAGANISINAAARVTNHGTLNARDSFSVTSQSLRNLGTLDAGRIDAIVSGSFENKGIVRSTNDVILDAGSFVNSPHVTTTRQSSDRELYPGCTTGTIGTCTAVVESATGEARVLAGRDIVINAPVVHNIGGSLIAARNIDIATNDFLNQDRELVANWQSTYANIDGLLLTKQGTTTGSTILATIPGVIQAGGLFIAREYPREPVLPPGDSTGDDTEPTPGDDEDDGSGEAPDSGSSDGTGGGVESGADGGGTGGNAGTGGGTDSDSGGSGTDPGAGSGNGTGSATNNGSGSGTTTGNGSGSGGTRPPVVIVPPPVVTPLVTLPPVAPPATTPTVSTPTPAAPSGAPINPPTRFVNTGVIQAGAIVIHADEIRNGFDPVADYHRRTDPPSLPPATVALAAPLAQAATAAKPISSSDGGGALMRKLLPANLAGTLPFALDAATEQAALRQAVQESTGRSIILAEAWAGDDGLDAETRQRAALQANATAFALTSGIALGTPLSEEQIAQLDAPMLWYVEQGGRLVPQLVLPEAERLRLAKLPGGLLQADTLVALSAERVVNTGYVISGGTLAVEADALSNLKRSTYYYEQHRVDGGTLVTEGDTVQPGGFMQALRWSVGAREVESRSGEFRVLGSDEAATTAASEALVADIAAALGDDFHYTQATDNLESRFIADKKKSGLGGLIGVVVAVVVAIVATPAVSAWVAGAAGATEAAAAGSAWAAATATTGAGIANVAATSFITGTVSSAAGQLASTGKVDLDAAFRNGLVSGLTSGITNAAFGAGQSADGLAGLTNQSGTLQPVAGAANPDWADQLLGIGARGVVSAGIQNAINGTSFETALRDALVGDLAAIGANQIGTHLQSVERALAHASLGAIAAELTGKDAAAGAIGALTSALAAQPIDEALGLTGETRKVAVTALAMLSGGIVSDALGYDPVTAANAALNEVTNNYLSPKQQIEREQKLNACGTDTWCQAKTKLAYEILSGKQDIGLYVGIGGGIGIQSYDGVLSVLQLLDDIPGAARAIQALFNDSAVRSQLKAEMISDYSDRLARLDAAYQDGGWDGSVTAGVEIGRLFADALGIIAAVKGTAQLGATLTGSLGRDAGKLAEVAGQVAEAKGYTIVIGRLGDLNDLRPGEISLLDRLPYLGNPQANWLQNAGVLREAMRRGLPIRDASPRDASGAFLNAERNLLKNYGWKFDAQTSYWMPPTQ